MEKRNVLKNVVVLMFLAALSLLFLHSLADSGEIVQSQVLYQQPVIEKSKSHLITLDAQHICGPHCDKQSVRILLEPGTYTITHIGGIISHWDLDVQHGGVTWGVNVAVQMERPENVQEFQNWFAKADQAKAYLKDNPVIGWFKVSEEETYVCFFEKDGYCGDNRGGQSVFQIEKVPDGSQTTIVEYKEPVYEDLDAKRLSGIPAKGNLPEIKYYDLQMPCQPKRADQLKSQYDDRLPMAAHELEIVDKAFRGGGMKYALCCGVLLSWYRDCHIRGDVDLDLHVFEDFDILKFDEEILKHNYNIWFQINDRDQLARNEVAYSVNNITDVFPDNRTMIVQYAYRGTDKSTFDLLDLLPVQRMDKFMWVTYQTGEKYFWFHPFNLASARFLNVTVMVPHPPICYLIERYGLTWKEPQTTKEEEIHYHYGLDVAKWSSDVVKKWIRSLRLGPKYDALIRKGLPVVDGATLLRITALNEIKSYLPSSITSNEVTEDVLKSFLEEIHKLRRIENIYKVTEAGEWNSKHIHFNNKKPYWSSESDIPPNYDRGALTRDCVKNPKKWLDLYEIDENIPT